MSMANINFSIKNKNVLYGVAQEEQTGGQTGQQLNAGSYTLNVCINGSPGTLIVYGPEGQQS